MDSTQKATGLAGLTSLMNQQHIDTKIDIGETEGNALKKDEQQDETADELYKLAKELDVKLDGMDPETISSASMKKPLVSRLNNMSETSSVSPSYSSSRTESTRRSKRKGSYTGGSVAPPVYGSRGGTAPLPSYQSSRAYEPPRVDTNKFMNKHQHQSQSYMDVPMNYDRSTVALTQEQVKRDHISTVLKEVRGETYNTFSTDVERVQDLKGGKLEQIASLKMSLEEEGIDTSTIPNVGISSPIEEIDGILNLLLRKNNRYRYSSMAEEVISAGAEILESVFDGTREVPVFKIKPDYTGYSSTVNVKLHRLRFDTSQIVGDIVERHNISPGSRIMMELLPGLLLYPRVRSKMKTIEPTKNLTAKDSSKSYNHIRDKVEPDPQKDQWSDMVNI